LGGHWERAESRSCHGGAVSTANRKRNAVRLAALALAAASSACATDAQRPRETQVARIARSSDAQTGEQAIARRLDGLYTASINGPALDDAVPGLHVPAGTWALRIDVAGHALRLIAPEGGDITLRLTGVDASHLLLAPDTACESRAGRTAASLFTWLRTDALLRLQRVRAPCRSDAILLTIAPWRAEWPTTPFTTNPQAGLR
jgi:hypothetical protein